MPSRSAYPDLIDSCVGVHLDSPRGHRGAIWRFVLFGGANTVVTFALFTALQHLTSVAVAYTVAFACGLILSTALTAGVVFGARTTWRRRAVFALCYLVIYGIGLVVSHLLHRQVPAWGVAAGTIMVTAPVGFLAGRLVLAPQRRETRHSP